MEAKQISVNNKTYNLDNGIDKEMPLLWFLRDHLQLTGTKYSCGIGSCGSCIVHLDGIPVKSCITLLSQVDGKQITTIEGLSDDSSHPIQQAWEELQVPQCGYCQSGQIMSAVALLDKNSEPSEQEINEHMSAVLCRCGTYPRIRAGIKLAAKKIAIQEKTQ